MANIYERSINRLKATRESNPYLAGARSQIGHLSRKYGELGEELETSLRVSGSAASRAQATQDVAQQYAQDLGNIYQGVEQKTKQRDVEISSKIADLEIKKKEYEEAERAKGLDSAKGLWKIGGQAAGAVAGAFGGDPLLGAQIGGAVGNIAGSFAGDEFDVNMAVEGVTGALQSYQNISKLSKTSKMNELNKASASLIPANMTKEDVSYLESVMNRSNLITNPLERSTFIYQNLQNRYSK